MHARASTTQRHRSPFSRLADADLHSPADGFCDAEFSSQDLHLEVVLCGAPVSEARFEWMCGLQFGCCGFGGGHGGCEGETGAQGVVNTGRRGRAGRGERAGGVGWSGGYA